MIKQEETKNPEAVEQFFCKPFGMLKRYPMSDANAEMLMKLLLAKGHIKKLTDIPDEGKPFIYQMLEKRIQHCFTFKVEDPRLILFLAMITETPGTAVMYLAFIQYWCKQTGVQMLDLETFCERIFPMGFPSEDDLHKLWDEQKVKREKGNGGSDNLLDYATAYKSIQFSEILWENLPSVEL